MLLTHVTLACQKLLSAPHCPLTCPRSPGSLNLRVPTARTALTPEELRQCNNRGSTFYFEDFNTLLNHGDYKDFIKVW